MSENNVQNFSEILNSLKEVSNSFNLSIYIPSLKKYVDFKELNTKQQKELLETVTDTSIYKTKFTQTFLNIIKENLISNDINLEQLTVYDKLYIGLFLRSKISNTLNIVFNENPVYSETVEVKPIIDNSTKYIHPENESVNVIKDGVTINVEIKVPTIVLESKYESELSKTYKKIDDVKSVNDMGSLLSDAFVGEVSKYINKISFNDKNIELEGLTVSQRIRLTELLTADLTQKVLQKISDWKTDIDNFVTVVSKNKEYKKVIALDNLLFLM
jgi:hypothetical protein